MPIAASYDTPLVVLSILIAVLASYSALGLGSMDLPAGHAAGGTALSFVAAVAATQAGFGPGADGPPPNGARSDLR